MMMNSFIDTKTLLKLVSNTIYNFELTNGNFFNIIIYLNHFYSKFTFYNRKYGYVSISLNFEH